MTNEHKIVKPSIGSNGKIGKVAMIVTLMNSGVPLEKIALAKDLTEEERRLITDEVIV
jgi:hypothetical protein